MRFSRCVAPATLLQEAHRHNLRKLPTTRYERAPGRRTSVACPTQRNLAKEPSTSARSSCNQDSPSSPHQLRSCHRHRCRKSQLAAQSFIQIKDPEFLQTIFKTSEGDLRRVAPKCVCFSPRRSEENSKLIEQHEVLKNTGILYEPPPRAIAQVARMSDRTVAWIYKALAGLTQ